MRTAGGRWAAGLSAVSKVLRMVLQSAVLGLGAYLVIQQEATGGIIIASSILTSRALAPVEQAIANWKGFVAARQSWQRLNALLGALPAEAAPLELPKPAQSLVVDGISVTPAGGHGPVVHDVSFGLKAGNGLCVIGPSASGKSSLVRSLVGVWTLVRGKIRLDGAALEQWTPERLGRHVGYLPQDVELFAGTVAQNIARFESEPDPQTIIAAKSRGRARADPVLAGRLRRPRSVKAARRSRPVSASASDWRGALWRTVPGGSRRAELEPGCGRRTGSKSSHRRRAAAAGSWSWSRTTRVRWRVWTTCS
jgi:ABC-type protease/lipase transport system fused ATPase/permease subunit